MVSRDYIQIPSPVIGLVGYRAYPVVVNRIKLRCSIVRSFDRMGQEYFEAYYGETRLSQAPARRHKRFISERRNNTRKDRTKPMVVSRGMR